MSTFNLEKQIEYWKNLANSDILSAEILIEKRRFLHGLFFCHLTIEKILKVHYVKQNLNLAPKTHNLLYLVDNTKLALNDSQMQLLGILLKYQLEGRYPENEINLPAKEVTEDYLKQTKELLEWLIQRL
jgi:HEPN domain-containing protein